MDTKVKMKNLSFYCSLLLFLCSAVYCNKERNELLGSYQSISESEWDLTLILSPNGEAEIILENWNPGEYEKRNIEKTKCRWKNRNNMVLINHNEIIDTLIYDPFLPLEIIGEKGGATGLLQSRPNYNGILNNVYLWKLPHNF